MRDRFWELPLEQLDSAEWEALCDGCGRCCMVKLEDEDSGELAFTNIVCRYLDTEQCRCTVYPQRAELVPDCISVTPGFARQFDWLPPTCAYRLRAHAQPLPEWHPLISGDPQSVHETGISVRGKVIAETEVADDELEEHIIHWVG